MMSQQKAKPTKKHANSSMSDKAFRNLIVYGALYVGIFLVGVYFAIFADMGIPK